MIGNPSLARVNRLASLAILPMMLLAIALFSRSANSGGGTAEPPSSGVLVVANLRLQTLTFLDLASNERTELVLPGPPHEMVEVEGRLYVTLGRANLLAVVDPHAPAIVRTVALDGEPHGIAAHGANFLVTLDKRNEVVVLDGTTLTELRRWPTGSIPHAVAASARVIVVTDSGDNALRQLEPGQSSVATGAQPESVIIVDGFIATADAHSGTVTMVDEGMAGSPRTVGVGGVPVRVTAVDGQVLAAVQQRDDVTVVSPSTGEVKKRLRVEQRPDGICASRDEAYIAVTSNGAGAVEFFGTDGWKTAGDLRLVAGLGACLWLAGE